MTAENLSEQRKTKFKFLGVYVFSVALIIAILASLWLEDNSRAPETETTLVSGLQENNQLIKTDAFLHSRLKDLDNLYAGILKNGSNRNVYLPLIKASENSLYQVIDSLSGESTKINVEQEKQDWNKLLTNFKNELQSRATLHQHLLQLQNNSTANPTHANNEEVQQLKALLEEKNRSIASLQASLQKNAIELEQNSNPDLNDLRDKLAKSKIANEKLQSQINAIKQSYQTVVEDNRRLLTQLKGQKKQ